jgi:hypothetical protein
MAIQIGFSPPHTTAPPNIADGSNLSSGTPETTTKNVPRTVKLLAAGGLVFGLGSFGLFASAGTAAAEGVDATPMPPAVIDDNGFQNYDTSSYAAPSSYPADSSWPGSSSRQCCSR